MSMLSIDRWLPQACSRAGYRVKPVNAFADLWGKSLAIHSAGHGPEARKGLIRRQCRQTKTADAVRSDASSETRRPWGARGKGVTGQPAPRPRGGHAAHAADPARPWFYRAAMARAAL